ncbi:hypothetical protein AX766_09305 [Flavobacterium covae]|nr:hypothetical protein AX766_09305 [Flavobacterium covae]
MNYMQNCKVEKLDFIETNRIIKNFNLKKYFIFIDKQELIENSCLSKLYTQQELDSLIQDAIYDELIILKSDIANFSSIEEFLICSIVKSNYIDFQKMLIVESKILSFKQELLEQDFQEILEWGFFDLFNYELEQKLELKYTQFKGAFTFFEHPLKPLFASILDNNYYLFINNSYT